MQTFDTSSLKITGPVSMASLPSEISLDASKKQIRKALKKVRKRLGELQNTLYAHNKYGVLVCIQGMDTAGKDSLIREVFKEFNVRGVVCHSFKVPTALELSHNFLWRHVLALPERGKYSVFNRTHYENVLVTRVHPEYIVANENLPGIETTEDIDDAFWDRRFEQINHFEKTVADNGTIIFKFFLNLSKDEQKYRLLRRLKKENKNWKFSPGDLEERKLWDEYMRCYEEVLNRTSKEHAPWYNIPADDKTTARYLVAKTLLDTMETYTDIREPVLPEKLQQQIGSFKQQLVEE